MKDSLRHSLLAVSGVRSPWITAFSYALFFFRSRSNLVMMRATQLFMTLIQSVPHSATLARLEDAQRATATAPAERAAPVTAVAEDFDTVKRYASFIARSLAARCAAACKGGKRKKTVAKQQALAQVARR